MALQKEIILNNGITLQYHRIVSINKITNNTTIIEIGSYINKEQREKELEYYNSKDMNKTMNVYIFTNYIEKEYNEKDTIDEIYKYLKTTETFKDSVDV